MNTTKLEIMQILDRMPEEFSGLVLTWVRRQAIRYQEREKKQMRDVIEEMIGKLTEKIDAHDAKFNRRL
jgi:hypothetical protein